MKGEYCPQCGIMMVPVGHIMCEGERCIEYECSFCKDSFALYCGIFVYIEVDEDTKSPKSKSVGARFLKSMLQ